MADAVYYCRVSTEEESQVNALENQILEAKECIKRNGWNEIAGYIDEGKSGTTTKSRNEYLRLLNDLETNKFDIIVVKSQDRLMRNTKDWYLFIDKLVTYNKKLFFYLENKFYTPDDALIVGIKAILNEEYSRDLSKKINARHKTRQKTGSSVVLTSKTWGYDKVGKEIVINEKEAKVVRLIYDLCIQGYGSRSISKELSNRGIKSRTGNDFPEGTVRKIIRNPLFMGTVIMNKRSFDFNTKKTIHNPEDEWIIHENIVPAIVSKEIWEKANKIMDKRSQLVKSDDFVGRMTGKNLGQYSLSSKIFCGECGSVYWRRYRKNVKGEQIVDWSCSEYVKRGRKKIQDPRGKSQLKVETKEGGCDNIHVKEIDLDNVLIEIAKKLFDDNNDEVINMVTAAVKTQLSDNNAHNEKEQIKNEQAKILKQKDILMDKLLDGIISNEDYKRKNSELENRLNELKVKEENILQQIDKLSDIENRLHEIKLALETKGSDESNLMLLKDHIDKIMIYSDYFEIYLDFFDPIRIEVAKKNKAKKYLYVGAGEYMIPHTDNKKNRKNKYKEAKVVLFI